MIMVVQVMSLFIPTVDEDFDNGDIVILYSSSMAVSSTTALEETKTKILG